MCALRPGCLLHSARLRRQAEWLQFGIDEDYAALVASASPRSFVARPEEHSSRSGSSGRKEYLGAVVVLVSAMRCRGHRRRDRLCRGFLAWRRRTIAPLAGVVAWAFVASPLWTRGCARLHAAGDQDRMPASLLRALSGDARDTADRAAALLLDHRMGNAVQENAGLRDTQEDAHRQRSRSLYGSLF